MKDPCAKGRPRDPLVDAAILEATLEVLAQRGFARFTVEEVASVAGVGKASIYRRFPDKDAVITYALEHINDDLPPIPDEGDTRDRLIEMLNRVRRNVHTSHAGRIMRHVVGESGDAPHLLADFYRRVIVPRGERLRSVLMAGVARGELPADFDAEVAIPALMGSTFFLSTWAGCEGIDDTSTEAMVDVVLSGLSRASGS